MSWLLSLLTLLCAAGMGAFYYAMEFSRKSPRRLPAEGREFHMPDVHFHNTPDAFYKTVEQAGGEGRLLMRRYWLLDFGFIASFWGICIAIGLNVAGKGTALFLWMGIAATARTAFDLLENSLFLWLLRAYPRRNDGLASVAGVMTSLKFVCLYTWVAMLFYKLFLAAFGIGA